MVYLYRMKTITITISGDAAEHLRRLAFRTFRSQTKQVEALISDEWKRQGEQMDDETKDENSEAVSQ